MAKVSVIVPVYNTSGYLRECLDSIIGQTFSDIEIICIDDGSDDGSLGILKEYSQRDSRVSVVSQANAGPSSARNAGLSRASGEFVMFVDSDDIIEKDMCSALLSIIGDCDLAVSGVRLFGDADLLRGISDRKYFSVPDGEFALDDSLRLNTYVSAWGKLFRRSVIEDNRIFFPNGLLFEDFSFYWQYVSVSKRISFTKRKMYRYRYRKDSVLGATFGKNGDAMHHLDVFEHLMNSSSEKIANDTKASIFVQCFEFAYANVPESEYGALVSKSKCIAERYNLNADGIIAVLRSNSDDNTKIQKIGCRMNVSKCLRQPDGLKNILCEEGTAKTVKRFIWGFLSRLLR